MILADKIIDERKKNGWSPGGTGRAARCIEAVGLQMGERGFGAGSQKGHSDGRALWREHGLPSKG